MCKYKNSKRVFSVMLCIVLLCMCVLPSLSAPADAVGAVPGLATMTAVQWILGSAGLTFGSAGAAYAASQGFLGHKTASYNVSDMMQTFVNNFVMTGTGGKITLALGSAAAVQSLKGIYDAVAEYFTKDKNEIITPQDEYSIYDNSIRVCNSSLLGLSDKQVFQFCSTPAETPIVFNRNGVDVTYSIKLNPSTNYINMCAQRNGQDAYYYSTLWGKPNSLGGVSLGVTVNQYDYAIRWGMFKFGDYYFPVVACQVVDGVGNVSFYSSYPGKLGETNIDTSDYGFPINYDLAVPVTTSVPYNRYGIIDVQKLIDALTALVDTAQGGLTIPVDDVAGQVEDGAKEKEDDIPKPYVPNLEWLRKLLKDMGLTDAQINDLVKENTDTDNPAIDKEMDLDVPTMPDIRDKFPFCVPFDLIRLVTALNARAVTPKFEVPINMDFVNYHDTFTIDFTDWEPAAKVIRWGTTIFFILGLIVVTRKMIQA